MSEFRWKEVNSKEEMESFFLSVLPAIRDVARVCGYAIGLHGSMRRDLDLMAVPWSEDHSDKDKLALEIHKAACGLEQSKYVWEQKPIGRWATAFPICWPTWDEKSLGHIDLSVIETVPLSEAMKLVEALRSVCNEINGLKIAELEIRHAIGNTNWEVLHHWKQNGLDALENFKKWREGE